MANYFLLNRSSRLMLVPVMLVLTRSRREQPIKVYLQYWVTFFSNLLLHSRGLLFLRFLLVRVF